MLVFRESPRDAWLLLLVVLMAIAANLPDQFAAAYSIEKKYLLMALAAIVAVSILRYLRFTLLLVTVVLAIGANLPAELAGRFNIDTAIMFFTLIVMVVIAVVNRFLKVVPDRLPEARRRGSVHGARALIKAISTGNVTNVHRLIQSGVNVNVTTVSGKTPLMLAVFTGYADIVQLLINAGADVHARDREGNTPMNIAERKGFSRIKALLAAQG